MRKQAGMANAGGAAANAGMGYQACIGAWFAAHLLLDRDIADTLAGSLKGRVASIGFEQNTAVDDIVVLLEGGQRVYIQAKRSLSFSTLATSDFAKAMRQFASQYVAAPTDTAPFVLAVTSRASAKIRLALPSVLGRLGVGTALADAALNNEERAVLDGTRELLRLTLSAMGEASTDAQTEAVLRRMRVLEIEPEPGGRDMRIMTLLLIDRAKELGARR